jgi:hypothetical protein
MPQTFICGPMPTDFEYAFQQEQLISFSSNDIISSVLSRKPNTNNLNSKTFRFGKRSQHAPLAAASAGKEVLKRAPLPVSYYPARQQRAPLPVSYYPARQQPSSEMIYDDEEENEVGLDKDGFIRSMMEEKKRRDIQTLRAKVANLLKNLI